MIKTENFAMVAVASTAALWDWLAAHHGQTEAVWLVTAKASDPARYISTDDILDALIAYGWIDGIRRKRDDGQTMQLISPRRMQIWAQTYQDRVARLRAAGRMQPPGEAAVARAQGAGLWDALAHVDALQVPDDLGAALTTAGITAAFAAMAPSYRRNVLRWIAQAKTPPTRARRVAEVAARTAKGEKVPQF
jgi:uncharacterized protein YdeI (YjbR/CyaY-like superfamily)